MKLKLYSSKKFASNSMASQGLFAQPAIGGGQAALIKFKAGKMLTSPVDGGPKLKVSAGKLGRFSGTPFAKRRPLPFFSFFFFKQPRGRWCVLCGSPSKAIACGSACAGNPVYI